MSLVKCRECGNEVSSEAKTCPKCGARTKKAINIAPLAGGAAFVLIMAWYFFGGGIEKQATQDWGKIRLQVANDAVAHYQMAKKGNNFKDMCVQAGIVADAYLQLKDEEKYRSWRNAEKSDCKAAGMPN
jgi:hypothetical protein